MMILNVITEARRLLAGDAKNGPAWAGPEHSFGYCLRKVDARLEPCLWDDEAVWNYTVEGALRIASNNNADVVWVAWEELRRVVAPSHAAADAFHSALPPLSNESLSKWALWTMLERAASRQLDLDAWLRAPERKLHEVLQAFDEVSLKLKRGLQ